MLVQGGFTIANPMLRLEQFMGGVDVSERDLCSHSLLGMHPVVVEWDAVAVAVAMAEVEAEVEEEVVVVAGVVFVVQNGRMWAQG